MAGLALGGLVALVAALVPVWPPILARRLTMSAKGASKPEAPARRRVRRRNRHRPRAAEVGRAAGRRRVGRAAGRRSGRVAADRPRARGPELSSLIRQPAAPAALPGRRLCAGAFLAAGGCARTGFCRRLGVGVPRVSYGRLTAVRTATGRRPHRGERRPVQRSSGGGAAGA